MSSEGPCARIGVANSDRNRKTRAEVNKKCSDWEAREQKVENYLDDLESNLRRKQFSSPFLSREQLAKGFKYTSSKSPISSGMPAFASIKKTDNIYKVTSPMVKRSSDFKQCNKINDFKQVKSVGSQLPFEKKQNVAKVLHSNGSRRTASATFSQYSVKLREYGCKDDTSSREFNTVNAPQSKIKIRTTVNETKSGNMSSFIKTDRRSGSRESVSTTLSEKRKKRNVRKMVFKTPEAKYKGRSASKFKDRLPMSEPMKREKVNVQNVKRKTDLREPDIFSDLTELIGIKNCVSLLKDNCSKADKCQQNKNNIQSKEQRCKNHAQDKIELVDSSLVRE